MAYPLPGGPPQGARDEALDVAVGRLRNLGAITEAALAHLELDPLLATLLARVREIVGTDTAAVLLLDHKAGELVVRAAIGIEEEVEQGVRIPLGRGFAGRIAAERQAIHIPDIDKADVANPILREKGIRSLLGVPLLVEGEVLGVLHVGSLEPREFSGDDAELLQMAADRMALAIDHAWLYEAERHARSLAERAAEDLRRLQTITDAALGRLTLDDELLVALLDRVTEAMNVDTAAILLLDADGEELVARATRGIEGEIELGVRIPVGSGFAGRIAAERRPVFLPDVDHADVLNPILHEKGVKSLLGVPLLVEGEVIGVLHVGSLEPRDFAAEEASLLERAADRIARLGDAILSARIRHCRAPPGSGPDSWA